MGQISMKIISLPGSLLSANQHVVIKTLLQAVEAGELDAAVAAAMGSRGAKSNKTVAAKV